MNQATKQRLIGTIVLGCLALIFIPMLLDGEGVRPPAVEFEIPPAPTPDVPVIAEPVRPAIVEDSVAPAQAEPQFDLPPVEVTGAGPDTSGTVARNEDEAAAEEPQATAPAQPAAEEVPAIAADGLPEGWVVRLGVFGERRNADKLLDELLAADYKAYTEPAAGATTGVYVGPVLTQAEAGRLQRELKDRFKLEGLVRRFTIEDTR